MLNFSLADLKLWFHLESLSDKENRYKAILDRIELLKSEQNQLIVEHEEEKKIASTKISNLNKIPIEEVNELCKAINNKYNNYFSNFLNRLSEIKREYNKEEIALRKLYKDEKFQKAQVVINKEFLESFITISQLCEEGKIEKEDFEKIKNKIVKGGFAMEAIRNWNYRLKLSSDGE